MARRVHDEDPGRAVASAVRWQRSEPLGNAGDPEIAAALSLLESWRMDYLPDATALSQAARNAA
jgi:hypothetical protein